MSSVYFDSSAFVKLLVEEAGSDLAADLWSGCDHALSSRLAYPEVRAALAAAQRSAAGDSVHAGTRTPGGPGRDCGSTSTCWS